jgi:hypothetical protein
MMARIWSLGLVLAAAMIVNLACGSSLRSTTPDVVANEGAPTTECPIGNDAETQLIVHEPPVLPDADETVVLGDLTVEQRGMVEWALPRFALAELELPPEIEFIFDPTAERCDGNAGRCHIPNGHPVVVVCEPAGETMGRIIDRRVTLLHELAHLWHWRQGDGLGWPDRSGIVGGEVGSAQVPWADRVEVRVAMAIAWGLMDQLRRPVGSDFACAELNDQFQALTGHHPLGPIRLVCKL